MWRSLNMRNLLLIAALTLTAFAIACGSDNSAPASTENGAQQSSPAANEQVASDGLNPECAQLVLGRSVASFTDLTESERTRVFSECSEGAGDRQGAAVGFDPACMEDALDGEIADFRDLTPEQRQAVFDACGGGAGAAAGTLSFGGRPGEAGANLGELLDTECMSDVLGRPVDDIFALTPEERREAAGQCLSGLSIPFEGQPEGFGQRQDDRPGRPGSNQAVPIN